MSPLPSSTAGPPAPDRARQSAIYCWIIGGITALLFSCCSCGVGSLAALPAHEIQRMFSQSAAQSGEQLTDQQMQAIMQLHPTGYGILAVVTLLLGLAPAVALVLIGFAVKKGSRPATIAAVIIVGVQTLISGTLLLMAVAGALVGGDAVSALFSLVVFGLLTAILVKALRCLWLTLPILSRTTSPPVRNDGTEPWDETGW